MKLKKTKSQLTIALILLLMIAITSNLNWGKDNWKGIIQSDGKGYYAYLPATFIYKDLNFGFFKKIEEEKYYDKNHYYDYRSNSNNKTISKYYCGTAIAEFPFFLIAHISSYLLHFDLDGYSKLYMILISIGALFYLLIGLLYLNAILSLYGIKEHQKSLI